MRLRPRGRGVQEPGAAAGRDGGAADEATAPDPAAGSTGSGSKRRVSWQLSPPTRGRFIALLVIVAILLAGSLYRPAYVILRAGPAVDTLGQTDGRDLVRITGLPTYPTEGALDFATVAQYGGPGFEITTWDLLVAWIDPGATVVARDVLYPPDVTSEQVRDVTARQMAGSQHAAAAVALGAIGQPEQAVVAQVAADGPAHGHLRDGDVVLSVQGTRVESASDVGRLVRQGGDTVRLRIQRAGATHDVAVPTRMRDGRRMIGIALEARFDDSIDVTIDAGNVGGPSAGMMFALAVYDKITPGALTGGQKIAGTGTMQIDGTVGSIGGADHKMVGAREAGASWFLVPAADCNQVVGNVPDGLHVAKVATFDEAREAVEQIAAGRGAALPTCTG